MPGRPLAPVHVIRLGPRLAVYGPWRYNGNRHHALRRIPGAGVHDVAPHTPFGVEKLLIVTRSGHRLIFEIDLLDGLVPILRILDADLPSPRFPRRRPERVDAGRRAANEGRPDAVPFQDVEHAVYG